MQSKLVTEKKIEILADIRKYEDCAKIGGSQLIDDLVNLQITFNKKKITFFNRFDNSLKISQIFGNTLEALVGAVFLDKGYDDTQRWVTQHIINPHLFMQDLENLDINQKNKLYGWANKNGKALEFETLEEKIENGRRLFTIGAKIDGVLIAEAKAFNKKDASQVAAQIAVEKLKIV